MGIMESELQPCTGKQEGVIKADYAGEYETGIRCLLCAQKSPRPSVFFELELYTKVIMGGVDGGSLRSPDGLLI